MAKYHAIIYQLRQFDASRVKTAFSYIYDIGGSLPYSSVTYDIYMHLKQSNL